MQIITTRNVYTGEVMGLCPPHYHANVNGDDQIQHGLHRGTCDACLQHRADAYDAEQEISEDDYE